MDSPDRKTSRRAKRAFPEAFRTWIAAGGRELEHPPCAWSRLRNGYSFRFKGVTRALRGLVLNDGQLMITVEHEHTSWDCISEFDVTTLRAKGRYYCGLCMVPPKRKTFRSAYELWSTHSFEPFAIWLREKLVPSGQLVLNSLAGGGATWATIIDDAPGTPRFEDGIKTLTLPLYPSS